jgi:hypothetical protein
MQVRGDGELPPHVSAAGLMAGEANEPDEVAQSGA